MYTELSEQVERAYKYRCRMEKCDTGDCRRMAEEGPRRDGWTYEFTGYGDIEPVPQAAWGIEDSLIDLVVK